MNRNTTTTIAEFLPMNRTCSAYEGEISNETCKPSVYNVMTGIDLMFHEAQMQSVQFPERLISSNNIFEIRYCHEGWIEYSAKGEHFCLMPGDFTVIRSNDISLEHYVPSGHYRGLSIFVDLDHAPACLSNVMEGIVVQPRAILEKFCSGNSSVLIRGNESVGYIFSKLLDPPGKIQQAYMKVKVLELLLYLSAMEIQTEKMEENPNEQSRVMTAKKIASYLSEHLDERVTATRLAEEFHLSETHIKNIFKAVYGVSPSAYIRMQRMESAANMLEFTEKSILEIAGEHGYDNGSKFANAFRSVKGMSPNAYRNHCKNK